MSAPAVTRGGDGANVGVGVFVTSEHHPNCVLLGIRKGSSGAGLYALPGGHQENGETWEECAIRETQEETGLLLKNVHVVHIFHEHGKNEVSMQGEVDVNYREEPQTLEPHKCEGWVWRDWNDFPPHEQLFYPLRLLREENFDPFEENNTKLEA
ncbi:nucleotide triphosphate diphosphatase NUDT15-like [Gigantopelta aegis]|uniref:nucleotide triphosphate diphosphatase NUDT15-like n=1 Tax=Gigantopelta aegis TaxID=1735272 RepID=UPI001B88E0DE|nr:nucleotide triphosphate diphosphatase NUDT15-like [Gigantopelta aegis]